MLEQIRHRFAGIWVKRDHLAAWVAVGDGDFNLLTNPQTVANQRVFKKTTVRL